MNVELDPQNKLVQATRVWVAQTFFGQMFRQMRNSPFKSDVFSGGRGGEAFQAQLDQRLAERMANTGAGDRIVRSIVRRLDPKMRSHEQADRRA